MYWKAKISTENHTPSRECYIKQTGEQRPLYEDLTIRGVPLQIGELAHINIHEIRNELILPEDTPDILPVLIMNDTSDNIRHNNGPQWVQEIIKNAPYELYGAIILLPHYKHEYYKAENEYYKEKYG